MNLPGVISMIKGLHLSISITPLGLGTTFNSHNKQIKIFIIILIANVWYTQNNIKRAAFNENINQIEPKFAFQRCLPKKILEIYN